MAPQRSRLFFSGGHRAGFQLRFGTRSVGSPPVFCWARPQAVGTVLALVVVWSTLLPSLCGAQPSSSTLARLQAEQEDSGYLPMHQFYETAKELDLDPNDLRLRALFDQGAKEELQRQQRSSSPPSPHEPPPLVAHKKNKNGGESIISREEIIAPYRKMLEERKEEITAAAMAHIKAQREQAKKIFWLPKVPTCSQSSTEKKRVEPRLKERANEVIGDVLFVAPKHFTTSSKEIFGEKTSLILYDTERETSMTLLAKSYEVDCLPYRIRATGTYLFTHRGKDALRNYDGDPHGDGESLLE
ncbi:hypothetical protein MRY87_08275 [bacterium]|nr:hypothetical protein [bacterium]